MAEPVSALRSVCSACGTVYERERNGSRCPECRPARARTVGELAHERRRGSTRQRGYDQRWRRLSERARRLQPFCSDCGRPDQLTADHSPTAWERRAAGLPIRLEDIDVVCAPCNAERGPARGPEALERPTMGSQAMELEQLEDGMEDLDDLDQRVARGEA